MSAQTGCLACVLENFRKALFFSKEHLCVFIGLFVSVYSVSGLFWALMHPLCFVYEYRIRVLISFRHLLLNLPEDSLTIVKQISVCSLSRAEVASYVTNAPI